MLSLNSLQIHWLLFFLLLAIIKPDLSCYSFLLFDFSQSMLFLGYSFLHTLSVVCMPHKSWPFLYPFGSNSVISVSSDHFFKAPTDRSTNYQICQMGLKRKLHLSLPTRFVLSPMCLLSGNGTKICPLVIQVKQVSMLTPHFLF